MGTEHSSRWSLPVLKIAFLAVLCVLAILLVPVGSLSGSVACPAGDIMVTATMPDDCETAVLDDCSIRVLLVFAMAEEDVFTLSYRHSVEQTWVHETFAIQPESGLVLVAMRYESFGAGLPYAPERGTFTKVGETYVWRDIDVRLGNFSIMSTPENQYVIDYPAGELSLEDWPAGTVFTFAVIENDFP